jgi:hypothetical protein
MITESQLIDRKIKTAKLLLMQSYEMKNQVNCFGMVPNKCNSIEYQKARKFALSQLKKWQDKFYYEYIKTNF